MLTCGFRGALARLTYAPRSVVRSFAVATSEEQGLVQEGKVTAKQHKDAKTIEVRQQHLRVSPKKLRLTISLVHKKWLPDAIAQMKFSPRKLTGDIENLIKRGATMATERLQLHPEELMVSEAIVNTGPRRKYPRMMGRGRTGLGMKRYSHLLIRVKAVDFDKEIAKARGDKARSVWIERKEMAEANREVRAQLESMREQAKKKAESKK